MREKFFSQSRCSHCGGLQSSEKFFKQQQKGKAIRKHHLIHATIIISVMNVTVGNQIHASDVYWRIISLQIVQNRTLWKRKFSGTKKILKLVRTDQIK